VEIWYVLEKRHGYNEDMDDNSLNANEDDVLTANIQMSLAELSDIRAERSRLGC
jgi:hypothetical protein